MIHTSLLLAFAMLAGVQASAPAPEAGHPAFDKVEGTFLALSVANLDESIRWYQDMLGLALLRRLPRQDRIEGAILGANGLEVEILAHDDARMPRDAGDAATKVLVRGIFKVGFRVHDFDGTIAALRRRGVVLVGGPWPARRDQRANAIIQDNSGNLIQIFGDFAGGRN